MEMKKNLRLLSDDQIPWVDEFFSPHVQVLKKAGQDIRAADLKNVDLLLVRTVTPVDEQLLKNTSIQWVGSATAGFDHIDCQWLEQQNIRWNYAPGSNAEAVAEYIIYCLAALMKPTLNNLRAGIIGVGHCGNAVIKKLSAFNCDFILHDPPRANSEYHFYSTSLNEFRELDLICIHTPLICNGEYPTRHLINETFLAQQKENTIIINAGRGEVIKKEAALKFHNLRWVMDVWPNEPEIDLELVNMCKIATPHIAGYSLESKYRATEILYQQAKKFFSWQDSSDFRLNLPLVQLKESTNDWQELLLSIYNPLAHTKQMKEILHAEPNKIRENFLRLRKNYILRREFSAFSLPQNLKNSYSKKILEELNFCCN